MKLVHLALLCRASVIIKAMRSDMLEEGLSCRYKNSAFLHVVLLDQFFFE